MEPRRKATPSKTLRGFHNRANFLFSRCIRAIDTTPLDPETRALLKLACDLSFDLGFIRGKLEQRGQSGRLKKQED